MHTAEKWNRSDNDDKEPSSCCTLTYNFAMMIIKKLLLVIVFTCCRVGALVPAAQSSVPSCHQARRLATCPVPRGGPPLRLTQQPSLPKPTTAGCSAASSSFGSSTTLQAKKDKAAAEKTESSTGNVLLDNIQDLNPATLLLLPIVFLFGIDLLLNMIVLTKRTFDYFVLGQAPSTETWW